MRLTPETGRPAAKGAFRGDGWREDPGANRA